MKCLSVNTVSGKPCRRTVAGKGCPNHGSAHIQERLRLAVVPFVATQEQQVLIPRLTREEIRHLVALGYEAERNERQTLSSPCGCQG